VTTPVVSEIFKKKNSERKQETPAASQFGSASASPASPTGAEERSLFVFPCCF